MFYISMHAWSLEPPPLTAKTEPGSVNRVEVCCMGRVRQESSRSVPSTSSLIASLTAIQLAYLSHDLYLRLRSHFHARCECPNCACYSSSATDNLQVTCFRIATIPADKYISQQSRVLQQKFIISASQEIFHSQANWRFKMRSCKFSTGYILNLFNVTVQYRFCLGFIWQSPCV